MMLKKLSDGKYELVTHLISDSSGETLIAITKAILHQFGDVKVKEYYWALTRTKAHLRNIFPELKLKKGIILFTLTNDDLKDELINFCNENDLFYLDILADLTKKVSDHLDMQPDKIIGKTIIDESYFKRIEAVNFTINYDDGNYGNELENADIVIFGPSRTSKSPTSMYLAFRGFKTANIPLVKEVDFNISLLKNPNIFFVCLTIDPDRLIEIRKNRIENLGYNNKYTDIEHINEEIAESRKFARKNKIRLIDVSRRSVEETAAFIIQLYYNWLKER